MKLALKIVGFVFLGLVTLALLLCLAILAAYSFQPDKLFHPLETNTVAVTESFENIAVRGFETDVAVRLATDGKTRVECTDREGVSHPVSVQDGTLLVDTVDERPWYRRVFRFEQPMLTLYLDADGYGALSVEVRTGDVEIPDLIRYRSVTVSTTTGDIDCAASTSQEVRITTTTGDIRIEDAEIGPMTLTATTGDIKVNRLGVYGDLSITTTTGDITLSDVRCEGDAALTVTTGKTDLNNLTCETLASSGSTGDLVLRDVVASGAMTLKRSTGSVAFDNSDAASLKVATSTGSVTGTLRTQKNFRASSSTGSVKVPESSTGGLCEVKTSTGRIRLAVTGK